MVTVPCWARHPRAPGLSGADVAQRPSKARIAGRSIRRRWSPRQRSHGWAGPGVGPARECGSDATLWTMPGRPQVGCDGPAVVVMEYLWWFLLHRRGVRMPAQEWPRREFSSGRWNPRESSSGVSAGADRRHRLVTSSDVCGCSLRVAPQLRIRSHAHGTSQDFSGALLSTVEFA
jgi:hypothetical protein